jgi:superfamily I DNA/RNA helicase
MGFTGASSDAMDLIAKEFNTAELPLTVSYRCAQRIVERAQTWVPHIEAHADAPAGSVADDVPLYAALAELGPTDAMLCRQTAPLVTVAYGLIARGRACRILGREIGEGLVNLIEQQKARGVDRLVAKLEAWREREMAKFIAKGEETRAEAVADRVDCVLVIAQALPETERTVPALIAKIRGMFVDPVRGEPQKVLTLCTVHKAKGKEWDKVAILQPELMPSRAARQLWQEVQEQNLQYVAATRAKTRLIYCQPEDTRVDPPKGER